MSHERFMVAIALGPVGAFIAGGRRSRDVWFGSRFLSEATRWVAHTLHLHRDEVALLIPLPDRVTKSFLEGERDRGPTISNKILCQISASEERVRSLIEKARAAAHAFLADEICKHGSLLADEGEEDSPVALGSRALLERQAAAIAQGDFIELHAGWARIDVAGGEEQAVRRAYHLLDGAKAMRLFTVPESAAGYPKCSLDPGWDSVLMEPDLTPSALPSRQSNAAWLLQRRQELGIRPDERLSGMGLARRLAALSYAAQDGLVTLPKLPFPPLALVAADAWLMRARRDHPGEVSEVEAAFRQLFNDARDRRRRQAAMVLTTPARPPGSRGDAAPTYDASLYFEGAMQARRRELEVWCDRAGAPRHILNDAFRLLERIESPVTALQRSLGMPCPYFALLTADGDGIGALLAEKQGQERHALVDALYTFADQAWGRIDAWHGCAFYVGGDELTAYLPIDQALGAARDLARLFADTVGRRVAEASLSVGIVLAHVHDDLRATRASAQRALKEAKARRRQDRAQDMLKDAEHRRRPDDWSYLTLYEEPRGGSRSSLSGPTSTQAGQLETLIELLNRDNMSMSTAYSLHELYAHLHPEDQQSERRQRESQRGIRMAQAILRDKPRRSGKAPAESADALLQSFGGGVQWGQLLDLATAITMASTLGPVARLRAGQGGRP